MKKICEVCGLKFHGPVNSKTCSKKCGLLRKPHGTIIQNICVICNKTFNTYKCNGKTCSKECDIKRRFNNRNETIINGEKKCNTCKQFKPISDFYKWKGYDGYRPYCKKCDGKLVLEIQNRRKKRFIEYKGGQCIKCGYNKYAGALEFHHRDPNIKEFGISRNMSLKFMKTELDKCDLLCSNCHREIHGNIS